MIVAGWSQDRRARSLRADGTVARDEIQGVEVCVVQVQFSADLVVEEGKSDAQLAQALPDGGLEPSRATPPGRSDNMGII